MKITTQITKKLILIVLICFSVNITYSQTIISGGTVSGSWNYAGSPYLVQGAIMIADGTSLTIEPGVRVEFQGQYKFLILGQLLAIGSSTDSITFTATDTTSGWLGIRFDNTAATNDSSKFYFCKFLYGKADGTSTIDKGGAFEFQNYSKAIISNSLISNCYSSNIGGGIYCRYSNPIIKYCTFKNNSTYSKGGAIYCYYSDPQILNTIFINNFTIYSDGKGAGIYCEYSTSNMLVSHNSFISNSAKEGAALWGYGGSPLLCYNIVENNIGTDCGGFFHWSGSASILNNYFSNNIGTAIHCNDDDATISYNTIENNDGIGILILDGSVSINKNIISNNNNSGIKVTTGAVEIFYNYITNNTAVDGAGLWIGGYSTRIENNLIANNSASSKGGGIFYWLENYLLTNNTIVNNQANLGGGIFCSGLAEPTISNTILWNNCANTGSQVYLDDDDCDPDFSYCNIEGGSTAFGLNTNVFYLGTYTNNIDVDPMFDIPSSGCGNNYDGYSANWGLSINSPCSNAGDPTGSYSGYDLLGNPRVQDGIIDIGAIEGIYTSVNDIKQSLNTNVFPNPSKGFFVINNMNEKEIQIEVFNINGNIVFEQSGSNKIDLSKYPKGIYLLKAIDGYGVVNERIILQ